ncbi:GspH/FimT family pseudopilin [Luteimonas sp. RD2P54]|uniref:Type II secretion system protein H n=1 Tax=Luteimonas endophytica TaxID=3042023 RepID=A0ABT6JCC7_9GAMM|nr:GspH/FimT family pseudopilin [Luteimonas endophytica]MDH5823823.1 GspH/FimT family pseudopilin [Luteimonas endophytica]
MTRKESGFTLIEAMAVLAIVAITLAIGLPAFGEVLRRQHAATAMHLVGTDLAMARSSAIMGRGAVVVCPRTPALRCRGDRDWGEGWMVFRDPDGDRQPGRPADILRASDGPGAAARGLSLRSSRRHVVYRADGRSLGSNLSVAACTGDRLAGKVIVSNLGRVRTERPARPVPCPGG